jgi:3-oxoacyl-[acyl-carrier protein] reductase
MSESRVALVTGASGGIGLATASALARAGYTLAVTAPTETDLEAASRALPAGTVAIAGDLGDLAFVASLAPAVCDRLGRIDLLVNNAAWRELRTMRDVTVASWERTLRVCLTAPAFLARDVAATMSPGGVVVNVSSVMAGRGFGVATAYVAAKAGLDAVTRDLAVLYGPAGVRVIGVAPGAVDTAMSADYAADEASRQMRAFSEQMIPAGRWARADEVAAAIVVLASDALGYLNGTTVALDGGWSANLYPRDLRERLLSQGETS